MNRKTFFGIILFFPILVYFSWVIAGKSDHENENKNSGRDRLSALTEEKFPSDSDASGRSVMSRKPAAEVRKRLSPRRRPGLYDFHRRNLREYSFLRGASLIDQMETGRDSAGAVKRVQIFKTDMKYPFVRVVEVVKIEGGGETTIRRSAMVAGHILVRVKNPSSLTELKRLVSETGARVTKKLPLSGIYFVEFSPFMSGKYEEVEEKLREREDIFDINSDYVVSAIRQGH